MLEYKMENLGHIRSVDVMYENEGKHFPVL